MPRAPQPVVSSASSIDKFDELKRYKELLDLNIITAEEFENKKNSIINS